MPGFFQSLNARQRKALRHLEQARGSKLQDVNPNDPRVASTPGAQFCLSFLEKNYPIEAAEFKSMSEGFESSLQAVMYDLGEIELTKEIHEEKLATDPVYLQQKQANAADWEKSMLVKMENEVRERQLSRGEDPDEVQVVNPHLMGSKFRNYAENLNLEARRERNAQG